LDILEFFGEVRRPLRAVEISRMLGMRPSTTDQLLKTMVDSSHLVFDARMKTYRPSPRLAGFSSWMVDTFGTDQHLRNLLQDVQERGGVTVTLTTPNDLFMQVLDLAVPDAEQAERGTRISVFGSSVGSAYLSTLEDEGIRRLADRARVREEEMPKILEDVARIRRAGYADGPTGTGEIWSIAMPLPRGNQALPMVLGVAGPVARVKQDCQMLRKIMVQAIDRWIAEPTGTG
jgi:DNA-binding IclR family transcriptional regulator